MRKGKIETALIFLLAAILFCGFTVGTASSDVYSIADGVNAEYRAEDKTLYISGSGTVNNNTELEPYLNYVEKIVIGKGIKQIGARAFFGFSELKSVSLPEGLVSIGEQAFALCTALEEISLPSTLQTIESSAFEGCTALAQVALPKSLGSIGIKAFSGCASLAAFSVADGNNSFGEQSGVLFNRSGDTLLIYPAGRHQSEYVVPGGTKTIGANAFSYHTYIESVVLPDGVESVENSAFYFCRKLRTVEFGSGLRTVGKSAFYGTALKRVLFPYGLESLGDSAFRNCTSLTFVSLPSTAKTLAADAFDGVAKNFTLGGFGEAQRAYAAEHGFGFRTTVSIFTGNGDEILFDEPGTIINDCTMVPMRGIFEALGAAVDWDAATRTALGKAGDISVSIKIGDDVLYKNGQPIKLAARAVISGNRTLVHARAIAEAFGADVLWDGKNGRVTIK